MEAAAAVVAPAAPHEVNVMRLLVTQLKEELRKRGYGTQGRKSDLQDCLKEAILLNVPVASGNEASRHDCMGGLDVTAKWVLLTWCGESVPKPNTVDADLWSSTRMNATMNPKYGFVETFDRIPFTGMMEKMQYHQPDGRSVNRSRQEKRRKRADGRHSWPTMPVEPRVLGSPNSDFLKW